MTRWIESRGGDLTVRAFGGALLLSAWYEAKGLRHLVHLSPTPQATFAQLALAALLFFSTCLGFALLILGHHLGDRIAVSDRWARRFPSQGPHYVDRFLVSRTAESRAAADRAAENPHANG